MMLKSSKVYSLMSFWFLNSALSIWLLGLPVDLSQCILKIQDEYVPPIFKVCLSALVVNVCQCRLSAAGVQLI